MQFDLNNRKLEEGIIRIPRKVARQIILHKHYRAFLVYLQLKPCYVSGVIMNDCGRIPYAKMSGYLQISVSGLRGKIRQLKKHKLIRIDSEKNIHLVSYKKFVNLFMPQYNRRMKKYVFNNIAGPDELVKAAAITDNYRKQEYMLRKKIIERELNNTVNAPADRIKQPEAASASPADCRRNMGSSLSKSAIRKIRRLIINDYDRLLLKHKRLYLDQLELIENNGYPEINPYITLSCAGIGRLFGLSSSAGHYQRTKMEQGNVLRIGTRKPLKIAPVSNMAEDAIAQDGGHVFSYSYPVKTGRGREQKFFLVLPDQVDVNLHFLYVNAKN